MTLEKASDIRRASEAGKNQIVATQTGHMDSEAAIQVNRKSKICSGEKRKKKKSMMMNYKSKEKNKSQPVNKCRRCGQLHELRQYPVYGVDRHECGKNDHFVKMCVTKLLIKTQALTTLRMILTSTCSILAQSCI